MARNSATKSKKKQSATKSNRASPKNRTDISHKGGGAKGPSEEDAVRTKPMHEVNGITGLSFEDEEEPADNVQWITQRGKKSGTNTQNEYQNVSKNTTNLQESTPIMNDNDPVDVLQFSAEDVQEELDYWSQAIVCFVLGANPPWEVLEGFVYRIWNKFGIDKISFLPNGIFLVRFTTLQSKEEVLKTGYHMFDNKPLIVKAWQSNVDLLKEEVKVVPAWIKLFGIPLKFWGKCLPKIATLVGPYVKSDQATETKTRLGFARVMVELKVGHKFPNMVQFKDENGNLVQVKVEYDWKPSICMRCKGMGHETAECRKHQNKKQVQPAVRKEWRPVPKATISLSLTEYPALTSTSPSTPVPAHKHNEKEDESDIEETIDLDAIEKQQSSAVQTGDPPDPHVSHE